MATVLIVTASTVVAVTPAFLAFRAAVRILTEEQR